MERTVEIVPQDGLHARPAAAFVQAVNDHEATVTVGRAEDENQVQANSMLSVTGLNATQGERLRIVAEGPDAEAALDTLEELLSSPVEDEE